HCHDSMPGKRLTSSLHEVLSWACKTQPNTPSETGARTVQTILPDLWETETEHPAPGLTTHAYLLTRAQGNILFYNTSRPSAWPVIEKLGGIRWQLLSHEDEVGSSLQTIRARFGAKLGIHELE